MGLLLQRTAIGSQNSYRRVLLDKKAEVLIALGLNCHRLAKLESANHEEQINTSDDKQARFRINRVLNGQLARVERVLACLELGEFGICLKCGSPISATRLRMIPLARYCDPCQQQVTLAGEPQPYFVRDEN